MDGCVNVNRLEELILQQASLNKDYYRLKIQYFNEFGKLLKDVFSIRLDCARKECILKFCKDSLDKGEVINFTEMHKHVSDQTAEQQDDYDDTIDDLAEYGDPLDKTQADTAQVNEMYLGIVRRFHPEINPYLQKYNMLDLVWNQVDRAYYRNNLRMLVQTETILRMAFDHISHQKEDAEIPDIEAKIRGLEVKIDEIKEEMGEMNSILSNDALIQEKKNSLKENLELFQGCSEKFDSALGDLLFLGAKMFWEHKED